MSKKILIVIAVIGALWFARSALRPKAPLQDGIYFTYDWGGSAVTVTFSEAGRNRYRAAVQLRFAGEQAGRPVDGDGDVVNTRMRTSDGRIFEVGSFGPFWISPSEVEVGGSAYGSSVSEIRSWQGWNVGVVKAGVGVGAALRGEWYYEEATGFLVGGMRATAVTEGEGDVWRLRDTNLPALSAR